MDAKQINKLVEAILTSGFAQTYSAGDWEAVDRYAEFGCHIEISYDEAHEVLDRVLAERD